MPTPALSPIPEGMHTITPYLWFNGDCQKAIQFYQKAFSAELMGEICLDEQADTVMHAMIKIGNSCLMLADAWPDSPEKGPTNFSTCGIWLYVNDSDAAFNQACAQGCEVLMPIMDTFWGDRFGKVRDPFGHCWAIATNKVTMTEEEMTQAKEEWEHSMSGCCC